MSVRDAQAVVAWWNRQEKRQAGRPAGRSGESERRAGASRKLDRGAAPSP
ncbi:hypothetical protein [Novacetimonas pomaceti]|nr:hypothetical protein [Novacetimonas pomaceti]